MNKKCLILVLAVLFSLVSCGNKKVVVVSPVEVDATCADSKEYKISVEPRTEVVLSLARVAGFEIANDENYEAEYSSMIDTLFGKHKESEVVKTLKELKKKKLTEVDLLKFAYNVRPDFSGFIIPNLKAADLSENWKKAGDEKMNLLLVQINQFVKDSNYSRVFLLSNSSYVRFVNQINSTLSKSNLNQWVTDFFKIKNTDSFAFNSVVLAGTAPVYIEADGKYMISAAPATSALGYVSVCTTAICDSIVDELWSSISGEMEKKVKEYRMAYAVSGTVDVEKLIKSILTAACLTDYIKNYNPDNYEIYINDMIALYQYEEFPQIVERIEEYVQNKDSYVDFKSYVKQQIK